MNKVNSKGFTLAELLAIIIILSIIFIVSFPTFLNIAKVNDERQYEDMVDTLCLAGKTYIYSKDDKYKNELNIEIEIKELIENKLVKKNIKNPKTGNLVDNGKLVYNGLTVSDLKCEYIEILQGE